MLCQVMEVEGAVGGRLGEWLVIVVGWETVGGVHGGEEH